LSGVAIGIDPEILDYVVPRDCRPRSKQPDQAQEAEENYL
jgi:hypothetical protein